MTAPLYKVLVADDDPTVALLMPIALASDAFAVTVVNNGGEALAEFMRTRYDIVVLDVEMPELDGFEVCSAIRQSRRSEVPVVLVSGHNNPSVLARAADLQATYLTKPLDWQSIATRLREILAAADKQKRAS